MAEGSPPGVERNSTGVELGTPLIRLLMAYSLTAASLAVFGYLWGEAGFEMLVVAMGWPHVFLGFIFYLRKIAPSDSPHRLYFWTLLVLTGAIWATHAWLRVTTLIYLYFVFHAFRDEIFIYRQRRTGYARPRSTFDRAGLVFLGTVMVLSGVDQLSWNSWRPVIRRVEVPLEQVAAGGGFVANFEPIGNSGGRDYYFELEVPEGPEPVNFLTYFADEEDATGRMFVDRRHFEFVTQVPFAKDLLFEPQYSVPRDERLVEVEEASSGRFPMREGHSAGQTFRAREDGLSTIWVPLALEEVVTEDSTMVFTLQSAFAIRYPFLEPAAVLALMLLLGLVSFVRSRGPAGRSGHERTFFLLLIALLFFARLVLDASRHYLLIAPLFFSFLVVFHYFSWYVFSLEKIGTGPTQPGASRMEGRLDSLLAPFRSRGGFLKAVVALNLMSLAGVLAYQSSPSFSALGYAFDLQYFLYFLVFHVTMSFAPAKLPPNPARAPQLA